MTALDSKLAGARAKAEAAGLDANEDPKVKQLQAEREIYYGQLAEIDEDTAAAKAWSDNFIPSMLGMGSDPKKAADDARAAVAAKNQGAKPKGKQRITSGVRRDNYIRQIRALQSSGDPKKIELARRLREAADKEGISF